MHYFAFGTNMNPQVMARKALVFTARGPATLKGYRLCFNKTNARDSLPASVGFANLVPAPDQQVEGVLYALPDAFLERLDRVERCPEHYERIRVTVETPSGSKSAETYRALPQWTTDGLVPSRNYINHILSAGDLLSPNYLSALQRLETFSGDCAICHKTIEVVFRRQADRLWAVCAPCLEAQRFWGDALGRELSMLEAEAVMQHVLRSDHAYESVQALLENMLARDILSREKRTPA